MAFYKIFVSFLLSFATLSLLFFSSNAQHSAEDYVNAHNAARGEVGVGKVTWNTTLATYALNYANKRIVDCALTFSNGPYGENLAKGSGSTFTGLRAVNVWVARKQYYDYKTNTCIGGNSCLQYTQVVWRNSVRIGCGKVQCKDGWSYVVCSYDPPGNWEGERPY